MAFSKDYIGDTVATGILMRTLGRIEAIIPGVTVNSKLAGQINAQSAEFYYNMAPLVKAADAGDDFNSTNVGNKKAVLPLTRALQIDEKIPAVALNTASDGGWQMVVAKAAVALENARGAKFIYDLAQLAQAATYTHDATAVNAVAEAIKTFNTTTSVKIGGSASTAYSNKDNGIEPNAIIIGDAFLYLLRKDAAFKSLFTGQGDYPRLIGKIFGLDIVYSRHYGTGFMLVYGEGITYPYSINTLRIVESEDFNGVRVQGEIAIPDAAQYGVLPIDSHAVKFTEA